MSAERFDVIVVGSGFGGSLIAMIARRLGFSTALLERGTHPRFIIGESTTPLTNLLLEELARKYELPGVLPLCKWGTWQRHAPQLACGLKRGFTFYHHEFDQPFQAESAARRQLLIGASPRDELADTHWYRPDFDHYLVCQAEKAGVVYLDEVNLNSARGTDAGMSLEGTRKGSALELEARFLIDASGPRGFLYRQLQLTEKRFVSLPQTQALFSHFKDVGALPDDFHVPGRVAPYPPENAAVHHVFRGGWIWVLKFNNGITSAGVAATDGLAEKFDFASGEPSWRRLLERLPSLQTVFGSARNIVPFIHQPRLAFQSGRVTGTNWALLPSAAGVIDPLLSTGFPLTLLGIERLAGILEAHWQKSSFHKELNDYADQTTLELDATATLVGALYATMDRFELFKALSLLYFAAASFTEVSRRLGKAHLAHSFLLCRDPDFAPQLHKLCRLAGSARSESEIIQLKPRIMKALAPFDLAGLTDSARDPFFPASGEDILRNVGKLGATPREVAAVLGFTKAVA
jgi:FADH2 O2-dependent halogenase